MIDFVRYVVCIVMQVPVRYFGTEMGNEFLYCILFIQLVLTCIELVVILYQVVILY